MTPELLRASLSLPNKIHAAPSACLAEGPNSEYGLLREVLLASPRNLSIVPCNRVSEDALAEGRTSCSVSASKQQQMDTAIELEQAAATDAPDHAVNSGKTWSESSSQSVGSSRNRIAVVDWLW